MFDNLVFLDFETCDLDPARQPVIEFGVVSMVQGIIRARLSGFIWADLSQANPRAMQVNRIRPEDVAAGLAPRTAFALLRNFIGDATVVCHNAAFDIAHLAAAYSGLGGRVFNHNFLCTKVLARHVLDIPEKETGLEKLCQDAGIPRTQGHRALGDALDTAQLLQWLLSLWRYSGRQVADLEALVNLTISHEHFLATWLPSYSGVYAPVVHGEVGKEVTNG